MKGHSNSSDTGDRSFFSFERNYTSRNGERTALDDNNIGVESYIISAQVFQPSFGADRRYFRSRNM